MVPIVFRHHLRSTRPFGWLLAALLGLPMSFVVFVGNIIGDCDPGPGCHDNDAAVIGYGLFITALIVLTVGALAWFLSALIRMLLQQQIGAGAMNLLLLLFTLLIAWFSLTPAIELMLTITA